MDQKEIKRFDKLYQRHLQMLKLQGKSEKTRDAYARAIRRLRDHFDCCPDKLTPKQVHIRRGKGHKDRFVLLPDLTLQGLLELWCKHRHPQLLFPNANGPLHRINYAKSHMDRGGAQKAMKVVEQQCGIKKSLHSYASQLCHPPSGTWPEPASYPALFGPCQLE